ncbi:discoidin domain-containing protein [Cohnella faecalis]|uniref:F5/8 type C domain-containing protein n=1 Tax=Cohnella faecalis TaxID=2315694 RepID=A0A398CQU9_9BACL|nr:discoidin domain-containing protein [Cohnella faecalis]RIE01801.1 hypothetical protein D3H35_13475 [Cohnella faecalis]
MRLLKKGLVGKKVISAVAALAVVSGLSIISASAGSNIIPLMTSNSSIYGTAYASSEWATHDAYKAFDHDNSTYWSTSSGVYGELRFTFPTSKRVTSYTVRTSSEPLGNVPKTWTLQGSNNGSSWTVLATESNWLYPNFTYGPFLTTTSGDYTMYRLVITANNGAYSTSVAEVQMFE